MREAFHFSSFEQVPDLINIHMEPGMEIGNGSSGKLGISPAPGVGAKPRLTQNDEPDPYTLFS